MPHSVSMEFGKTAAKLKKMSDFLTVIQGECSVSKNLKLYLGDSTFCVETSETGQVTLRVDFAPGTGPSGDGYNALSHLANKHLGHRNRVVRKPGGKYHLILPDEDSFDLRLIYSAITDEDMKDEPIEDSNPGVD